MRSNYLTWDQYFMAIAELSAERSKDPSTTVGACIVSPDKRIIGVGYNGLPAGLVDADFNWENRDPVSPDSKYKYVVHAELNAILNCTSSLKGATLYVTLFPCNECAKAIIQAGIGEVVYREDKYAGSPEVIASKKMLVSAGIKVREVVFQEIRLT